ncbi:MAG: hypothetical protein HUK40_10480 [Desulfobacter sp.]|nr:hypothetical protein [Desulfobacter sp.]WDP84515.1 MAG: hypothetical protein HUN05_04595 [Desulfobacter sp.]
MILKIIWYDQKEELSKGSQEDGDLMVERHRFSELTSVRVLAKSILDKKPF